MELLLVVNGKLEILKKMKNTIFYIVIILFLSACKVENKSPIKTVSKVANIDLIEKKTITKTKVNDTLKKHFLGKKLNYFKNTPPFSSLDFGSVGIHTNPDNNINYSLGHFNLNSEKVEYIVFFKRTKEGKVAIDILNLVMEKKLEIEKNRLNTFFCYKGRKNDQEIIAIAEYEEKEFLTKILKAWRADRKTEKIIEIPVDGIKVENIDYGL